jgi:hypothetical protein
VPAAQSLMVLGEQEKLIVSAGVHAFSHHR